MSCFPSRLSYLLAAILLVASLSTQASVIIWGTRVIVTDSRNGTSLTMSNPENSGIFLVQSYITPYTDESHKVPLNKDLPFIVTPPLFRIDPGQQNIVRIMYTGQGLPTDKESVFFYHAKAIPQLKKDSGNILALTIDSALKLFYRPEGLTGKAAAQAYKKITFSRENNKLTVTNPTPYHINFYEIMVGNEKIDIKKQPLLMPNASASYPLPAAGGNDVQWKTIGDIGDITKVERAQL